MLNFLETKARVLSDYEKGIRYREENRRSDYSQGLDVVEIGAIDSARHAVAFGNIPFQSGFRSEKSVKENGLKAILEAIIRKDRHAFTTAQVEELKYQVVEVMNSRKAGKITQDLITDMDRSDNWDEKAIEMCSKAFMDNTVVGFFTKASKNEVGEFDVYSRVAGIDRLILDKEADGYSIQKSSFVGYDKIMIPIRQLKMHTDNDMDTMKEYANILTEVQQEIKDEVEKEKSAGQIQESEVEEAIRIKMDEARVECAVVHCYDAMKKTTKTNLIAVKYRRLLSSKKKALAAINGEVVRFDCFGLVYKKDNGFYSKGPLYDRLTFNKIMAEIWADLIEVVRLQADNPVIVAPAIYKQVATALNRKDRVISAQPHITGVGDSIREIPKPQIGGLQQFLDYFGRYKEDLTPELSKELVGQANTRLTPVHNQNLKALENLIKTYTVPTAACARNRIYTQIKLLRLYGNDKILVNSLSIIGGYAKKILKSTVFGNEREGTVLKMSIDIKRKESSSDAVKLLQKRELIGLLRNSQTLDKANVEKYMIECYEDTGLLDTKEKYWLANPYAKETVEAVFHDLERVLKGEEVQPSRTVAQGYLNVMFDLLERVQFDFTDEKGNPDDIGKRLIKYAERVRDIYNQNSQEIPQEFLDQENADIDAQLRDRERQQTAVQTPAQGGYDVQSDYGIGQGNEPVLE